MLVSLVLATVGRTDDVERCLRSMAAQTDRHLEVLLVDQNADDRLKPCVEMARSLGLNIRHLRMENSSLSGARNLGISASRGEIIGFPDDDCWYEPEVIAQLRSAFSADQRIAGVVANWVEQAAVRPSVMTGQALSYQAWRDFRGGDASSISLFFKRSVFEQLSGFDERMGVGQWFGAAEETDFVLRALAIGARVQRLPAARVHHAFGLPPKGSFSARGRSVRARARGTGAIYAKHRISPSTILRGLVAPVLLPLMRMRGWDALALGASTSLGRLEGMIRWGRGRP